MAELSRQYGLSRETVYKWLRRWQQQKDAGLEECVHATRLPARAIGQEIYGPVDYGKLALAGVRFQCFAKSGRSASSSRRRAGTRSRIQRNGGGIGLYRRGWRKRETVETGVDAGAIGRDVDEVRVREDQAAIFGWRLCHSVKLWKVRAAAITAWSLPARPRN